MLPGRITVTPSHPGRDSLAVTGSMKFKQIVYLSHGPGILYLRLVTVTVTVYLDIHTTGTY
jgi:hypothetical protein